MPTTPINGLPTPDNNSPNLPPLHFQALADQIDSRLVPRFANVAERDAAIPSPIEGQMCHVAAQVSPALPARLMVYSESRWRLVGPSPLTVITGAWTEPAGQFSNNPAPLTSVTIPDPGFPYRLSVIARCELGAVSAGTRWDLWVRASGGGVANYNMDFNQPQVESTVLQRVQTPIMDPVHVGQTTVYVEARRAYGTANGNITALSRALNVYRHAA